MINRTGQNWPAGDVSEVCACGAPMKDGVCSKENCIYNVFGAPISTYSRAEAIADGVLVDMETAQFQRARTGLGISFPVAMTKDAFTAAVEVADAPAMFLQEQDSFSRYWDVCFALRFAITRARSRGEGGNSELLFAIVVSERGNLRELRLKSVIGPADDASPCITIMLPEED